MKTYIISLVVIVFAVVIIFITMNKNKTPDVVIDPVVVTTPAVLSFFTWRYEDAGEDKFGLIQTYPENVRRRDIITAWHYLQNKTAPR